MKRAGLISWGMLHGQPDQLHRYLMLYDELWVPSLKSSFPSSKEIKQWGLNKEHLASMSWLEAEEFLREPPIDVFDAPRDALVRLFLKELIRLDKTADKAYRTPEAAARAGGVYLFNYDIALTRLSAYVLWRDQGISAYPVAFPFNGLASLPSELQQSHSVLSVVFKRFPVPDGSVPLEDVLAFKRDSDTQRKFGLFWQWVRKSSASGQPAHVLEEELDSLIADYTAHLTQLKAEVGHERLETVLSVSGEVLEDLVKVRWGNLAKRFLQMRKIRISANAAELKLPGNEVAYVTEASRLLSTPRRK